MTYRDQKQRARTFDNTPTLTDQASARDTDINVIVGQFLVHGQAPGAAREPIYDDFTDLPDDFRGYIERARSLKDHKAKLPPELQNMSIDSLLALTPEELKNKLTPPQTEATKEETK